MRYGFIVPEGDPRRCGARARRSRRRTGTESFTTTPSASVRWRLTIRGSWYGPLAGASRWILESFHEEASLLGGPCLGGSR